MDQILNAAHLCIDMQNIFAKGGVWETPWMEKVLPVISDVTARYRERTVFTRFVTPQRAEDRPGQWQAIETRAYRSRYRAGTFPSCAAGLHRRQACLFGVLRFAAARVAG
jgi:nicotinamidase-related amidase